MLAFRFDGTFEGLLSAVYDAYMEKQFPDVLLAHCDSAPLAVTAEHHVETRREKADRVFAGLTKRLSREGKNTILLAFLSEKPDSASILFRSIRKVFDAPQSPEGDFTDSDMLAMDQLARKVYADYSLLLGFTRFQKSAQGVYFAAAGPKYNILSLLVPHFKERFACHPWIIYDVRRGFGYFHENGAIKDIVIESGLLQGGRLPDHLLAQGETDFQEMWQAYFAAAAIQERINPTLQARCLPPRFRPYMTEMQPPVKRA